MARIAGVDLPKEKRVEIGLTYIYGIGLTTAKEIIAATGVDPDIRVKDLSEEDLAKLRNFSENILLLAFSFFTLRAASDTLRLRFKEPPAVDAPDTQAYVDELLPAFCERYNLTARERVIVEQVLQGKDNQNIASSLQLALGTVKAHVHNILKKTGVSTRQELTQLFWKG